MFRAASFDKHFALLVARLFFYYCFTFIWRKIKSVLFCYVQVPRVSHFRAVARLDTLAAKPSQSATAHLVNLSASSQQKSGSA